MRKAISEHKAEVSLVLQSHLKGRTAPQAHCRSKAFFED